MLGRKFPARPHDGGAGDGPKRLGALRKGGRSDAGDYVYGSGCDGPLVQGRRVEKISPDRYGGNAYQRKNYGGSKSRGLDSFLKSERRGADGGILAQP